MSMISRSNLTSAPPRKAVIFSAVSSTSFRDACPAALRGSARPPAPGKRTLVMRAVPPLSRQNTVTSPKGEGHVLCQGPMDTVYGRYSGVPQQQNTGEAHKARPAGRAFDVIARLRLGGAPAGRGEKSHKYFFAVALMMHYY